jgi:GDP-fucose transporter C1
MGEITRNNGSKSILDDFPIVSYDFKKGMEVMPLSLIFVGMITFNNLCLQYVQVSFCKSVAHPALRSSPTLTPAAFTPADNVARCLSLVFNVIFTYMILGKSTSFLTCSTLLVVIIGFVCGIQGEIDFSMVGTAAGVLSSVFVSLNSIYTARILPVVDNDKSMLLYYNNLNATVLFIPLIFLFETDVRYNPSCVFFPSVCGVTAIIF